MPHEAALLDPQVVKVIFLFGLLLGVLGSLFLAYDLLGSQEGPLRKFLRLALPGLLGALTIVPVYLLAGLLMRVAAGVLAPGSGFGTLDPFQVLVWMPAHPAGPYAAGRVGRATPAVGARRPQCPTRPRCSTPTW